MPAYHSKLEDDVIEQHACSCGIIALKTNIRGPAEAASPGELADICIHFHVHSVFYVMFVFLPIEDEEDIIDETLNFFRANILFRNFDVKGKGDRTLIYLTLYTHYLLVKAEKMEDRATGGEICTPHVLVF